MKKDFHKIINIVLLLTIIFTFLNIVPVYGGGDFIIISVVWGDINSPILASPGDKGLPLRIYIRFNGNYEINGLYGLLSLPEGFTDIYGNRTTISFYYGQIYGGSIIGLTFWINVGENLSKGDYHAELEIKCLKYTRSLYETKVTKISQKMDITLVVIGRPNIVLEKCSETISYLSYSKFNIAIKNNGTSAAYDIYVILNPATGLLISGANKWYIEKLMPKKSYLITARLRSLSTEGGIASITIIYKDLSSRMYNNTYYIGWKTSGIESTLFTPLNKTVEILGGFFTEIRLGIKTKLKEAYNISLSLQVQPPLQLISQSKKIYGYVKENDIIYLDAIIYSSDAYIGRIFKSLITIEGLDKEGKLYRENVEIFFMVTGTTHIVIFDIKNTPSPAAKGDTLLLSATILNKGTSILKYVNVSVIPSSWFMITMNSYTYIGDLPPNSPTPFTLSILVNQNISDGDYTLPICIYYTDEWNHEKKLTYNISINVSGSVASQSQSSIEEEKNLLDRIIDLISTYRFEVLFLVVVLLIIILFLTRRRRGKEIATE